MMNMQIMNINRFFEAVNACRGVVWLHLPDQPRVELKGNALIWELLRLRDGILCLSVEAELGCDKMRLLQFMLEDAA